MNILNLELPKHWSIGLAILFIGIFGLFTPNWLNGQEPNQMTCVGGANNSVSGTVNCVNSSSKSIVSTDGSTLKMATDEGVSIAVDDGVAGSVPSSQGAIRFSKDGGLCAAAVKDGKIVKDGC